MGEANKLERVEEQRFETIVPLDRVEAVIQALRASHPYEEPAFDLVQLVAPPEGKGMGRIGQLPAPVDRADLIVRIKREMQLDHVLVAGPTIGPAQRLAACAGACGNLVYDAADLKADLYLTGELRHHDALKAASRGMTVVCACTPIQSERSCGGSASASRRSWANWRFYTAPPIGIPS